jgi:phosphatidylglycerol:prolipoprotein diacylglycerol transferase
MKPELFHIAGLTIYGYGFCILVGVVAAFFHLYLNRVRLGMDTDSISTVILICFVGVFVGGKFFYFLEDPAGHWSRMDQFFGDLGNGFVFYGSFLVTLAMLWVWMRKIGWDFWDKMDDIGIGGAFVHGFGKLGCFLAGCIKTIEIHIIAHPIIATRDFPLLFWIIIHTEETHHFLLVVVCSVINGETARKIEQLRR